MRVCERGSQVLLVDDDAGVLRAIERALVIHGFEVQTSSDGSDALRMLAARAPDVVVLDVSMPDVDGLEVCRRLRAAGDPTPVLMLTARVAVGDRVAGLDAGADDYLVKPFALEELLARLRALLRRAGPTRVNAMLRYGDLTLDTGTRRVTRGDRPIELTRTEFALLHLLLRHPGQVLTREVISADVWGYDFGPASNSLDVYIGYLRRKTEAPGEARLIQTVRGVGYVLRDQ
ncbi:MAG: response regulator transcription factor [Actinomycetota bacterium]|nr:response regulator transcription factor [Actinomycetota bacterium]MDA8279874.1 response regulator transcription factor [Actinomycetota bacterium]